MLLVNCLLNSAFERVQILARYRYRWYSDTLQAGRQEQEVFSSQRPGRLWGPYCLLSSGVPRALSSVVKRPGREDDHSPPSVEVKNGGAIPLLPHMPTWRGH
jgi:hypothetical protein